MGPLAPSFRKISGGNYKKTCRQRKDDETIGQRDGQKNRPYIMDPSNNVCQGKL